MEAVIFQGLGSHQVSIKTKDTHQVVEQGKVVTKPVYRTESVVFKDVNKNRVSVTDPDLYKVMKDDPRFKVVSKEVIKKEKEARQAKREASIPKGPINDMLNRVVPDLVKEALKPLEDRIEALEKAKK
jgi:hypothetical protein